MITRLSGEERAASVLPRMQEDEHGAQCKRIVKVGPSELCVSEGGARPHHGRVRGQRVVASQPPAIPVLRVGQGLELDPAGVLDALGQVSASREHVRETYPRRTGRFRLPPRSAKLCPASILAPPTRRLHLRWQTRARNSWQPEPTRDRGARDARREKCRRCFSTLNFGGAVGEENIVILTSRTGVYFANTCSTPKPT